VRTLAKDPDYLRNMRKYERNMRTVSTLAALVSPTRQAILTATFLRPEKSWYLSELATHIGTRSSSLQRDVDSLVRVGILAKRLDGRRSYLKANEESPIFSEIRGLIEKTSGIVPTVQDAVGKLGKKIRWGFIYGSLARGEEGAGSDVDLMLIGNVSTMEMGPQLRRLEKSVSRQINTAIFIVDDFVKNLADKNHFLLTVMRGKKIMVKGTEDELEAIARSA
jgi:DNA-binding transcriptional ArsR family regulator